MKAIILAAGMGLRLKPLTDDLPKCLAIVLHGKPLLEWQMETLSAAGVQDITIVRGYHAEKICYGGVRYVLNPRYDRTNILGSLWCAAEALAGDVVVAYADIWYDVSTVRALLQATADIAIAVDPAWRRRYQGRDMHPVGEAETVVIGSAGQVTKIGKIATQEPRVDAEFIGMMKLTDRGCRTFREQYAQAAAEFRGKPFQRAAAFEQAYLTDLLQAMADAGIAIQCQPVGSHWREIDTIEDLRDVEAEFVGRALGAP